MQTLKHTVQELPLTYLDTFNQSSSGWVKDLEQFITGQVNKHNKMAQTWLKVGLSPVCKKDGILRWKWRIVTLWPCWALHPSGLHQTYSRLVFCFTCSFLFSLNVTFPLVVKPQEKAGPPDHRCFCPLPPTILCKVPACLSLVFCTPFLHSGVNPTLGRPPLVVLLFSAVPESASDWRGRSNVGHTLTPELVFLSCFLCFLIFTKKMQNCPLKICLSLIFLFVL